MTREEASKILRDMLPGPIVPPVHPGSQEQEAILAALSALRPVSREQVEKVWRGEWIDKPTGRYGQWQTWCSACGKHSGIGGIKSNRNKPFCPNCGAAMTDEAVEIVMERWKEALE